MSNSVDIREVALDRPLAACPEVSPPDADPVAWFWRFLAPPRCWRNEGWRSDVAELVDPLGWVP